MKILHTADWHLGDTFHGFDRQEEHRHFLEWLSQTIGEQQPDALLLSGDIFDNPNPPAAAERLFYDFLCRVSEGENAPQIVLTAGNHDSSSRLEAPAALFERLGIEVRGTVPRDKDRNPDYRRLLIPITAKNRAEDKVVVMAVPFLRPDDYGEGETVSQGMRRFIENLRKKAVDLYGDGVPLVLMAHFYAVGSEISAAEHSERLVVGGQDCVDCSGIGKGIAYAALGHIHKAQGVGRQENVRYAGSVLPMSFAERNYKHGVNLVTIEQDRVSVERLPYEPLRSLLSIPEDGSANYEEVLKLLSGLPKAGKAEENDDWPYLEVKVNEIHPDPAMANGITTKVEGRKARLCRIVRVRPTGDLAGDTAPTATAADLRRLNPALLARTIYKNVYNEDMPDEIARLFAQAKRRAEAERQGLEQGQPEEPTNSVKDENRQD